MKFIHQNKPLKDRRQELRIVATPQEIILWKYLRRSNLDFKFERQHSIGQYIVDFYCPKKKLIIEVDGDHHNDNKEYDTERTRYLESLGNKVIRFWNGDINNNLGEVVNKIIETFSITPSLRET